MRIFLITPWYDFSKNREYAPHLSKIYGIGLIIVKICITIYTSMVRTVGETLSKFLFSQKVCFYGVYISFMFLDILTILKSAFWHVNTWKKLFKYLQHVDLKLSNRGQREPSIWRNFYLQFFLKQIAFGVVGTYQMYVWCTLMQMSGMTLLFFNGVMQAYVEYLIVLLVNGIVQGFKSRYEDLNLKFCQARKKGTILSEIRSLVEIYRMLGESVNIFNTLFGYQFILIIFRFGIEFINALNSSYISVIVPIDRGFYGQLLLSSALVMMLMTVSCLVG